MNCESVAPSHAKTIGTNFALKSFHTIVNLVSELWNTIEFPLRILYFTPNFTDMLLLVNLFNFFMGGGIASSSFILFFHPYWYSYIIVYFVCDSASEFGAMGSTSFWGFSYPNLLLVFLNLLFLRNLFIYFIFLPVMVFLCSIFCL